MATIAASLDPRTTENLENIMNATARTIRKSNAAAAKAAKVKSTRLPRAKVTAEVSDANKAKMAAMALTAAHNRLNEASALTDPRRADIAATKADAAIEMARLRALQAGLPDPFPQPTAEEAAFNEEHGSRNESPDNVGPTEDDLAEEREPLTANRPEYRAEFKIPAMTARQRALMLAIGRQEFTFFDGGVEPDEGIWHAQLTDEASGPESPVATTAKGVSSVIAALGRKDLLNISGEQGGNGHDDEVWVSLTESGAAVARSLAEDAPEATEVAPTPKPKVKPAPKVAPKAAKPVAKPVEPKPVKPVKAAKAKPVAVAAVDHPKVVALANYAFTQGWVTDVALVGPSLVLVSATRSGERLETTFIDGKLDLTAMPRYIRVGGSVVLLRNVSAVKKQMDSDSDARPVKAARSTAKRAAKPVEGAETPQRSLPFDPSETSNEDIAEIVAGSILKWRRTDGTLDEAVVGKKVTVSDHPRKPGKANRVVHFWTMVESEKRGMISGPERHVGLDLILTVGK